MTENARSPTDRIGLGWREWVSLPELGIDLIKAKVDTGARTSCLHTFRLESFKRNGQAWVRFWVHPEQNNTERELACEAAVVDQRTVSDSGGHKEKRYVIVTPIQIGDVVWPMEMTLTNRDNMRFRMLLGRTAMAGRAWVDPEASFLAGKPATGSN
ncbi:ATP-dependent zinc protease family protein [Hydrocarboniclastica marina]|uniref:ATP-dependent zinc protease n=1 Tax=Hydrocarboniclastica marina TaxID=2259620 RepID=A0A4P7XF93_9ALTE|nr:ATP-dependent zinc protease [Hydrocarboniclastica marina]MAL99784.1 ATP-dependent zinc protease [Alteromonadaceae bacterium]QCF25243.1 ATP-dependent zinc protease [Hydrocarboniclastica marina]|tara:strand:- start:1487 stop:1954 length:468 start_codon:yes stop_codon:yes gene_type:complete